MFKSFLIFFLCSFLISCSNNPAKFDSTRVDKSLTPSIVATTTGTEFETLSGKNIIWGGTILDTRNLKDSTQLEVLAYPLNASYRPLTNKKPLGRFLIKQPGYLEAKNFSQGRQLSVQGRITGKRKNKVGESDYTFVVVIAEKLHLWPTQSEKSKTSFHFGIGIGL